MSGDTGEPERGPGIAAGRFILCALGTPLSVEPVAGTSTGRLRATALRNMLWRIYLLAFAPCLRTQELGPYPPPPSDLGHAKATHESLMLRWARASSVPVAPKGCYGTVTWST